MPIGEVVPRVLQLVEREVPVVLDEQRLRPPGSEVERLVADATKAKTLLQWEPEVDLDAGLKATIDWIRDSLGHYKASTYNVKPLS